MQWVSVVASFKSGKMDLLCVCFGHYKYSNLSHLLWAGPAPVKFLQSETSISWQPGVVSLWRNTVVMGNRDHGERNKFHEWLGVLSDSAMKAGSKLVLLWKPEQSLATGQWALRKLLLLISSTGPLNGLGSARTLQAGMLFHASLCSLAPFLLHVIFLLKHQDIRRMSYGWLGGTLSTLGHLLLLLRSCAKWQCHCKNLFGNWDLMLHTSDLPETVFAAPLS